MTLIRIIILWSILILLTCVVYLLPYSCQGQNVEDNIIPWEDIIPWEARKEKCAICGKEIENDELEYWISIGIYLTNSVAFSINTQSSGRPVGRPEKGIVVCKNHLYEGFELAWKQSADQYNRTADEWENWWYTEHSTKTIRSHP